MINIKLNKINKYLWEIPKDPDQGMLVPCQVFAMEDMIEDIVKDRSLMQLRNVASLPGIRKAAMVMPDVHEGYGFPIGGIAAMDYPGGVISPGGIGYDINCGVRLILTEFAQAQLAPHLEALSGELYKEIPSGTGKGGRIQLNSQEMNKVLKYGAAWAVQQGYGETEDLERIESGGMLSMADPHYVSEHARKRGYDQLGTIGAGNHFVEVDIVKELYDEGAARAFGLSAGQVVVLVHTGSRGLGHQVATDYIRLMQTAMEKYDIRLKDRELACAPFNSSEGQQYFKAMCAAANYAWCNREIITWEIRNAWKRVFGASGGNLKLLYDVAHNIAKIEEHHVDGLTQTLLVHRKGATRAFGPGSRELPPEFCATGQPVLIPGSMGTASYVLAGDRGSMDLTFGSACHGAGRRMSRHAAKKIVQGPQLKQELRDLGIYVQAGSFAGIAEEAPIAYKDVNKVVETVHKAGIARKVARLEPVVVIKG